MNTPYVLMSIAILVAVTLLLLVLAIHRSRGEQQDPNYRVFFMLGIIWLPIGVATDNPGLLGMGAIFLIVGLLNRDKWKDERGWSDLSHGERRFRIALVGGLLALLVIAVAVSFVAQSGLFAGWFNF